MSLLDDARKLLFSPASLLTPFVIQIEGLSSFKIYGDPNTMSNFTDVIQESSKDPLYITLSFKGIPHLNILNGFLWVWYYLNGLTDDITLTEILKAECYVIPMAGYNEPMKVPSKITPAPASAYYFLRAFAIGPREHIWGIWFLGVMDGIDSLADKRAVFAQYGRPPPEFIPPPIVDWRSILTPVRQENSTGEDYDAFKHVPPKMTRFDREWAYLFPDDQRPLSVSRHLGREMKGEEIHNMLTCGITKRRAGELAVLHVLDHSLIAVTTHGDDRYIWQINYYNIRDTKMVLEAGKVRDPFVVTLELQGITEDEKIDSYWKIMYIPHLGTWITNDISPEFEEITSTDIQIQIYESKFTDAIPYNRCDRLTMKDSSVGDFKLSNSVKFSYAGTELGGNLVTMSARSHLVREIVEKNTDGDRKFTIDMGKDIAFQENNLWTWLNGGGIWHGFPITAVRYFDYFNAPPTAPLVARLISMGSGRDVGLYKNILRLLSSDDLSKMPYVNKLIPISDLQSVVILDEKELNYIVPYKDAKAVLYRGDVPAENDVGPGDLVFISRLGKIHIYRIKAIVGEFKIILVANVATSFTFTGGRGENIREGDTSFGATVKFMRL